MPSLRHHLISVAAADAPNDIVPSRRLLKILFADDMPELREVAAISLSRDGHQVDCVEDGALALEKISADPTFFDLLITDHNMPKLTGLELVMQLRQQGFPGKIMVFSSELSREINHAYQRLNVDRIVYKPIFPADLRQVLDDLYAPLAEALRPESPAG